MAKHITTSIKIEATPQKVWKVLTDYEKYSEWNPFITSISGNVKRGNQITVNIQKMTFNPKVLIFKENSELKWLGHLWFKGLFDGEHRFYLTANENGTTTLEHSEKFSGILVRLFSKKIDTEIKRDFKLMNKKLKERVENFKN